MFTRLTFLFTLVLATSFSASATTFTVNTTNDTVDANLGNNICADAAGKCSLRAAVMQANAKAGADNIHIPAGTFKLTKLGSGEDAGLTGDLDVQETVTITGAGSDKTIIDGISADRIFDVQPIVGTPIFKVQGVHLTNGSFLGGNGGGIQDSSIGKLILIDTLFNANFSPSVGGAVMASGPVEISDSVFDNNQALSIAGALAKLGVGDLTVTNSRFEGNIGTSAGGAIYAIGAIDTFEFTDSEFIENSSLSQGGALTLAYSGPLVIDGSSFVNNSSQIGGGIVSLSTLTTINITDSEFVNNFAISGGAAAYCVHSEKAKIVNTKVTDNTGYSGQSAFMLLGASPTADIEIVNSNMSGNSTGSGPGGALMASAGGSLKISGSTFNDNRANSGAGALYGGAATTITISDSKFFRNSGGSGPGGAIFMSAGATLTFTRATFGGNQSYVGGGAAYLSTTAANINESAFYNNVASAGPGGAMVLSVSSASTIRNTTFSGNTGMGGGGLYGGGPVSATNVTFAENFSSVPGSGSAVYWGSSNFSIKNSVFADKIGSDFCSGGTFVSGGQNVFEDNSCGLAAGGDQLTGNAKLVALADNGGNTMTHALAATSPALDKFTGNGCPSIDQRGQARPFDGNDDGSARCDSGAFESHDQCPNDPNKLSFGFCGCGVPDVDTNGNGIFDCAAGDDLEAQGIALKKLVGKFQTTDSGKKRKNKVTAIKKALNGLVEFSSANALGISVEGSTPLDKLVNKVKRSVKKALDNQDRDFLSNKDKAKKSIKKLLKGVVGSVG